MKTVNILFTNAVNLIAAKTFGQRAAQFFWLCPFLLMQITII